ncbi:hypothetical protein KUV75_01535 [Qipengyuania gaetbuli]|uniref:hypothetical protein n=1 Tax=Qipengyuania gaetbuli TaxID=266952 RepID=UPI001C99A4D1|nr:hypothetical protein [Qipengyuania gaetbuli]MBY6013585.1 hypothetical protein [Qipengyuania gaetbuli]
MTKTIISIEHRLQEFVRRLEANGLRFPESEVSPGLPHFAEIARLVSASQSSFGNTKGTPSVGRLRVMAYVEKLGLMPYSDFILVRDSIPDLLVERDVIDEAMVALNRWVAQTKDACLSVPESPVRPGQPYFALIGRAASIDPNKLPHPNMPYRSIVEEAVADLGLMNAEQYASAVGLDRPMTGASKAQLLRAGSVEAFVTHAHIGTNVPLPESRQKRGVPHYSSICKSVGFHYRGPKLDEECLKVIDAAAQIVGIGADGFKPIINPVTLTYIRLSELCIQKMKFDNPQVSKSTISRFKSSLRKWQSALGKEDTDRLEDDFGECFEDNLGIIGGKISRPDTRRHWLRDMARCAELVGMLERQVDQDLPADFAGALSLLIRRGAYRSLRAFCRDAGVLKHVNAVRQWTKGEREPVRPDRTLVYKVEDFLGVERDTLAGRIRAEIRPSNGDLRVSNWPSSLDTPKLRQLAKPLIPDDWTFLSEEQRQKIGQTIREEAETKSPFRLKLKNPSITYLKPIPSQVLEEWHRLVEYKTALVPESKRESKWAPGSVSRNWNEIHLFLTALSEPVARGGLGVPPKDLTLAYLSCSKVLQWYIQWQYARSDGELNTGVRTWLGLFGHLTTLRTSDRRQNKTDTKGFLHNVPEWAGRLKPISGLVTESDIADRLDPMGWETSLVKTSELASASFKELRETLKHSRDPFWPILPILEGDRPMDALIHMLQGAYEDLPDPRLVSEFRRAIAVRRFVTLLVAVRTALRRKNLAQLTYSPDNTGKIRRAEDGWRIEISSKEFKNWHSPFFGTPGSGNREKSAYVYTFPDTDTAILDEYANVSRPLLLKNSKEGNDGYFVSKLGTQVCADQITFEMQEATWIYLVYHEVTGTGIKGVEMFCVHAIRDIVATHILKTSGNVELAADAIQDTPRMVLEHYARFRTSDRIKRVTDFLQNDLPESTWGRSRKKAGP